LEEEQKKKASCVTREELISKIYEEVDTMFDLPIKKAKLPFDPLGRTGDALFKTNRCLMYGLLVRPDKKDSVFSYLIVLNFLQNPEAVLEDFNEDKSKLFEFATDHENKQQNMKYVKGALDLLSSYKGDWGLNDFKRQIEKLLNS